MVVVYKVDWLMCLLGDFAKIVDVFDKAGASFVSVTQAFNTKKLVINPGEAKTVRHIHRRYAAIGSVLALQEELDRDSIKSKIRVDKYGRQTGGKPLARGALYLLLQNRIYRGEIVHKDQNYPGQHAAIIHQDLWDETQKKLASNRVERKNGVRAREPSMLAVLIHDAPVSA
jgi:DNA invertase Pin-like site-specific DNA recombinase